jgi:hypothetical protein
MLEVLQFVFSSFWIWLGSLMMLTVVSCGIAGMISSFKN